MGPTSWNLTNAQKQEKANYLFLNRIVQAKWKKKKKTSHVLQDNHRWDNVNNVHIFRYSAAIKK